MSGPESETEHHSSKMDIETSDDEEYELARLKEETKRRLADRFNHHVQDDIKVTGVAQCSGADNIRKDKEQYYHSPTSHSSTCGPKQNPFTRATKMQQYGSSPQLRVYKRRFYILFMYSVASVLQIVVWNTWPPIADTVISVLGWTKADIALLTMWSGIISVFVCIPFAGIMDKYGIRTMFLLAETLALIGVFVRCLPVGVENLKWTANIGQFFIGLAGPFLVQGPSLVSSVWFPSHQRTTATAVSAIAMELGMAASFIIGPLVVTDINIINATLAPNQTDFDQDIANVNHQEQVSDTIDPVIAQKSIDDIYQLLYIECDVMVFLYIVAWIYFPTKPPTPPSISASKTRESFIPGAIKLLRSCNNFWLPSIAYCISLGVFNTWSTQLNVMFRGTLGIEQDTVGWIAFVTYISGVIGGLLTARWADYLGGRMRLVLLALTLPAIGIFVAFILLVNEVIPFNLPTIYITALSYGFLLNSTRPIYQEMICEGVYPVSEGITLGVLNWMNSCISVTFLSGMLIPNIGVYWMNFVVMLSIVVTFLILVVFKEQSKRLAVDGQIRSDYDLLVIDNLES